MKNLTEIQKRQQQLWQKMETNSIAILPAGVEYSRNGDTHFPFRQQSDFWYLTAFPEPDAVAVFIAEKQEYHLFCRPVDPLREKWEGKVIGPKGACEIYGANRAYDITELKVKLPELLENRRHLYYDFGSNHNFDHKILRWLKQLQAKARRGIHAPLTINSLMHLVHEFRLFKSEHEINLMKNAIDISITAIKRAREVCKPGMYEYEIEAEIRYQYLKHGAQHVAYPPIIASGANACVLHYQKNNAQLKNGDLLLIDAGAEFENYAADITRTFPINGKFTDAQRAIYDIVLAANKAGIESARTGNAFVDIQAVMVKIISQGLIDLKILTCSLDEAIAKKHYFEFYPHNSGHWLGLDTHDVGSYIQNAKSRQLQPGMVLTVEPGIYIDPHHTKVADRWKGIGIRIEDDVLITANGPEVLTQTLEK